MKTLMTAAILLLTLPAASLFARAIGPVTGPALDCSKVDVGTSCYILQRDAPTPVLENQVLTYVALKDARCPIGVTCVWAGYVKASFTLQSGDSVQAFDLLIDPRYKDTNYYVDEVTGLTVILDDVAAHGPGPVPQEKDQVKVTVIAPVR